MDLYYIQGSPNCRKVSAVLSHLGLKANHIYLDLFAGDLASSDLGDHNRNRKVPTLVDGDLDLWESNAIMQYLCEQPGGEALFPRAPKARADVARWMHWELAHYNRAIGSAASELLLKPLLGGEPNQVLIDVALTEVARFAPVLETALEGRTYLVGDAITLADYAVAHLEVFADKIGFDWTPFPNITAYYARMRQNPHWAGSAVPLDQLGRKPQHVGA